MKSSLQKLTIKYSPQNCLNYSDKIKTISDAINSKAPSIGNLQRTNGKDFITGLLMAWLVYVNKILNLKNPMSEEQIELCSKTIIDDYYGLKISDITLIFKKLISGQYGKFYERLSISDILSVFENYFNERCMEAEKEQLRKHDDFNSNDREAFDVSKNLRRLYYKK